MFLLGGALNLSKSHPNIVTNELNFIKSLMKVTVNFKLAILKNLQTHYKGYFDKILRQINLTDNGIVKTMFDANLPPIGTNTVIHIPVDPAREELNKT